MNEYPELKSLCERFLANCDHPSRKVSTEEILKRMYTVLKERYEPPPTLGVSVTDGIQAKAKVG